jgi:general secretion pathway protein L
LIYCGGTLAGVRQIDWGSKDIADAIGAKYGLNSIQGMSELQSKGFVLLDKTNASREQVAFSQVIEDALGGLIGDLRLKMLELQSEMNLQWSKGSIVGGGAQLKNLSAYLTQHLQIPFNRFRQFEHQPTAFESDAHLELISPVAVGLALEGLKRPRNPATNFLSGEFASQSRFFEALWEKWAHTAQLVGAAFLILLVYSVMRDGLTATLMDRSDEVLRAQAQAVAGIKSRQASPERIRRFIHAQEGLEKIRKQAEKVLHINSALDVLNAISGAVPARERIGLEIKRVSINDREAEVHGYVNSAPERDQVLKAMKQVASNGQVQAVNIRIPVPKGKVGFAYKVRVERMAGG